MGAALDGIGLEMAIISQGLSGGAEQGQQGDREGIEEPQPIAALRIADADRPMPMPKRRSLVSRNGGLDAPALCVEW